MEETSGPVWLEHQKYLIFLNLYITPQIPRTVSVFCRATYHTEKDQNQQLTNSIAELCALTCQQI